MLTTHYQSKTKKTSGGDDAHTHGGFYPKALGFEG